MKTVDPQITVIGVLEFTSIAAGIRALDAMVKAAPVTVLDTKTICPGKYVVLITGEVAAVDASLTAGKETSRPFLIDELFIPNLNFRVIPGIKGKVELADWDALGVIESFSVTASIEAADIAAKQADIQIPEIRLATGMGGKSYVKVVGAVEDVEAAVRAGVDYVQGKGLLCQQVIIPRPHPDIRRFVLRDRREEGSLWN